MTFSEDLSNSKYLIDIKDYRKVGLINKGGFGSVYLTENIKTNKQYAAKIIYFSEEDDALKQSIDREINIMMNYPHPTMVKFYGYSLTDFDDQNSITIIMQFFKNGSLDELIKKSNLSLAPSNYDNTARQKILIGIACGMIHLHKHRIIHRDLKPGNILLDDNFKPLITDFGLSKVYQTEQSLAQSKVCGTNYYMAPEIYSSRKYNSKVDVYSFGIIMYSVITDCFPYSTQEDKKLPSFKLVNKIIDENYRPKFTVTIKKSLQRLIERCWAADPNARPTFEDIFSKLAYGKNDSFYDFSDDEDDGEPIENKYYLDNVDIDELNEYIEDITKIAPNTQEDLTKKPQPQTSTTTTTTKPKQKVSQFSEIIDETDITKTPSKPPQTATSSKVIEQETTPKPVTVEFTCQPSETKGGILTYLQSKISDEFDRPYTISLSSRDPYDMLRKDWTGAFFSGDFTQFYIVLTLRDPVNLIGFEIEGAGRNLMRGYEVFIDDDKEPFLTVKDDTSMRDKNVTFQSFENDPKRCKKFTLVPKGGNWDRDPKQSKFISIRKIELFTTQHKKGLMKFFRKSQPDPHLFPVKIDSYRYSTEHVHSLDATKLVLTENQDGEYCDVKFINGAVSVNGYRLKIKKGKYSLRGWKIVGKTINDEERLLAEFEGQPPNYIHVSDDGEIKTDEYMKAIRIIRTLPNNDGTKYLEFFHFEVFGNYIKL